MKLRTIINISRTVLLSRENFNEAGLPVAHKISYNFLMRTKLNIVHGVLSLTMGFSLLGCATELPVAVDQAEVIGSLVVGRIVTVLTGKTSRRFPPEVRFFELENQSSHRRFQVEVRSHHAYFAVDLPSGQYQLTRVQISEGPFMSMSDLSMTFLVDASAITYVGTWKFGVDSPRYGRMITASVVADQTEAAGARDFLDNQYPTFGGRSLVEALPQPLQMETRLYEVMPYPRYPRYFRRHWW